jgi:hypothetical protein
MTEEPSDETIAHLLGDLSPAAQARLAERLARDPPAAAQLKASADALAQFALAAAPAQAPEPAERQAMLAAVLRAAAAGSAPRQPSRLRRYFWPLAAAAMLALNLAQWYSRPAKGTAGASLAANSLSAEIAPAAPAIPVAMTGGGPAGGAIAAEGGASSLLTMTAVTIGGGTTSITITSGVKGGLSRVSATFPYGLSAPSTTFFPSGTYSRATLPSAVPTDAVIWRSP